MGNLWVLCLMVAAYILTVWVSLKYLPGERWQILATVPEHGGESNRDGNGEYWDDPAVYPVNPIHGDAEYSGGHQEMWRWQSLRDFVYPNIQETRLVLAGKTVINGLEWNVPGHEHCSTAIHQDGDMATAVSEFEYRFRQEQR